MYIKLCPRVLAICQWRPQDMQDETFVGLLSAVAMITCMGYTGVQ